MLFFFFFKSINSDTKKEKKEGKEGRRKEGGKERVRPQWLQARMAEQYIQMDIFRTVHH